MVLFVKCRVALYSTLQTFDIYKKKKAFENIVGKGENSG